MILQALYNLAMREQLVADPDYEPKPLCWVIEVNAKGQLIQIHDWRQTPVVPEGSKKLPRPRPKPTRLPREGGRTSDPKAFLLHDKAEYIFGIDPANEFRPSPRSEKRRALFKQRVSDCLAATGDTAVGAVFKLLEDLGQGRQTVTLNPETGSSDLFGFLFSPDVDQLITDRPNVREYWRAQRVQDQPTSQSQKCLVTGAPCVPVDIFPSTKKVPGGTTSGVSLVSFNFGAAESYGWKNNANAPISREAAEACATALNRLVDPAYPNPTEPGIAMMPRRYRLSADTIVCYWAADQGGDEACSVFANLFDANPEQVAEMYRSIWKGMPPAMKEKDSGAFYALVLSGAQGRAIVRDWIESTVGKALNNLAAWFKDLRIVRNAPPRKGQEHPPAFPMSLLLESLAPLGDREQIPPNLSASLVRAALQGTPYPESALVRALERHRAEIGRGDWIDMQRRDARVALIKAIFRRNPSHRHLQEVKPEMDPTNDNSGYLLGQLMAVLERLQQEALGDVNASVIDRYFSGASACPKSVFVRLMKNARYHVRKAQDEAGKGGLVFLLERLIDSLADHFDPKNNGFPASLSLEDQGMFILGYHQMRKWLWMNKDERRQWEGQYPNAPRAYCWSTAETKTQAVTM